MARKRTAETARLLQDDVYQISPGGRTFGAWPHNLGSVAFNLAEIRNYSPYNDVYFDLVLLHTQSFNRRDPIDRSTDNMTKAHAR